MYRIVAADEIAFHERAANDVGNAEVVKSGGRGSSVKGNRSQYSQNNKKSQASIVSDIIEKNGAKRGEKKQGVWQPLGSQYFCNGAPDTVLGEYRLNKRKKKTGIIEYPNASRRMIQLEKKIQSTQKMLKDWKIYEQKKSKLSEKKTKKKDDDRTRSTAPREETTLEKIQGLGFSQKTRKKQTTTKKATYDFANETDASTLVDRWRQRFAKVKKKKEEELLDALVSREEDKQSVHSSKILRNNAAYIVGLPAGTTSRTSQKSTARRFSSIANDGVDISRKTKRSYVRPGDVCLYKTPIYEVMVTVVGMETREEDSNTDPDEKEWEVLQANGVRFSAFERFLTKQYKGLTKKKEPKRRDLSLWEKAKLKKLRDMQIEAPEKHFMQRVRPVDLRRSAQTIIEAARRSPARRMSPKPGRSSPALS